jgi:translocator protein
MVSDDARNRGSEAPARSVLALAGFVAACFVAALVGSAFTAPSIPDWYENLAKLFFTPPSWLFGPAWTALYLAMAFAGWLVWRGGSASTTTLPLAMFGGQLVLNALWSVLFFGLRSPGVALVEILVLWAAILATLLLVQRISRVAGSWRLASTG